MRFLEGLTDYVITIISATKVMNRSKINIWKKKNRTLFRRQQSEIINEINIDDNPQTTKTIGPLLMPDPHAKIPANKKLYYRLGLDCVDDLSKVDLQNIVKVSFISVRFA